MSAVRDAVVLKLQAEAAVTALATGGIYPGTPPEGADFPLVMVTSPQPARANRNFQGIAFEDSLLLVRAVTQDTSPAAAADIAAEIRTALHNATLTVTGYSTISVLWERDFEHEEVAEGRPYKYEGAFYSVWVEPN